MPAQYNQLPGPIKEAPVSPVPKYPPAGRLSLDSSKYLIRKQIYPDSLEPSSIISFTGWTAEKMNETRKALISACKKEPGNIVRGANHFPNLSADRLLYFLAAGFSQADAEFLSK